MIVAYLDPEDAPLMARVREAIGLETIRNPDQTTTTRPRKVAFRNPANFTAADADPLDTLVYAHDDAMAIREAYARMPAVTLCSLDVPALTGPDVPAMAKRRSRPPAGLAALLMPTTVPEEPSV